MPDRLLDPQAGVGAEAGIEARVEPLGGGDESDVAFTDEVFGVESTSGVVACDRDDQAEVGLDQFVACILIAFGDPFGERALARP